MSSQSDDEIIYSTIPSFNQGRPPALKRHLIPPHAENERNSRRRENSSICCCHTKLCAFLLFLCSFISIIFKYVLFSEDLEVLYLLRLMLLSDFPDYSVFRLSVIVWHCVCSIGLFVAILSNRRHLLIPYMINQFVLIMCEACISCGFLLLGIFNRLGRFSGPADDVIQELVPPEYSTRITTSGEIGIGITIALFGFIMLLLNVLILNIITRLHRFLMPAKDCRYSFERV